MNTRCACVAFSCATFVLQAGAARADVPVSRPLQSAPAASSTSSSDDARAAALFSEGMALAKEGKYPEACAKLEASLSAREGLGTAFNLADCWEKIGRTASAHALFAKVAVKTRELGQHEREQAASARVDALAPKLSRLRLSLSAKPPGTVVLRDGSIIPETEWEQAVPVDPGSHAIELRADGKVSWSRKVDVIDRGTTTTLVLPELADAPKPPVARKVQPTVPPPRRLPPKQTGSSGGSTRSIVAWSLVGVGAAGAGLGVFMALRYSSRNDDAEAICPRGFGCDTSEIARHDQLVDDARTARTFALIGTGVGVAAFASAGYLFFSAPSEKERPSAKRVTAVPLVSPDGSWGAALSGRF
jgi:hypothetical protein